MTGIYVRVSTQEQAQEGYSIGEQIDRLTKYCDAMGWGQPRTYTDPGYSGGNTDRPALQDLISDVKNKRINRVVVYKLDRLSRSQLDTLYLIEKVFFANEVAFVSMSENFDTSTPFGKAMVGILAVFAQLEREQIKERLMMGKEAKIKDGYWIGSVAPAGYQYIDGRLVVDDGEAAQVRELFKLFNKGTPLFDIETQFADKGYTLRGKPWRLFTIRYILDNKTYCGYLRSKDGWTKGIHTPIITEDEWNKAHDKMERNRERFSQYGISMKGDKHSTLLGGLLYCRQCGARYGKRQGGRAPYTYFDYSCYSKMKVAKSMIKDPNCQNKHYRVNQLDTIIIDAIKALTPKNAEILVKAKNAEKGQNSTNKRQTIEKKIAHIDTQISRFLDLYGVGRFSVEQLDEKLYALEEQKNQLKAELPQPEVALPLNEATEIIQTAHEIIDSADLKGKREIVQHLINRIEIDGDDIIIHWAFV